jgi:hypothetical protein
LNAVFLEWMERLQKCVQVDGGYVGWAKRTQYIEIDFNHEIRLCSTWRGIPYISNRRIFRNNPIISKYLGYLEITQKYRNNWLISILAAFSKCHRISERKPDFGKTCISMCWFQNGSNCNNRDIETSHSRRCDSYVIAWNRMDPDKISTRISFVSIIQNKVINREFHSLVGRYNFDEPAGIQKEEPMILYSSNFIALDNSKSCNDRQS